MIPVWTLDFETHPIGPRPEHYPPEPVGLAYRTPEGDSGYLAWDHPSGNNCSRDHAHETLFRAWNSGLPIVFHNAKFDTAVCYERLHLPALPWDRVHDTMFLGFLTDPYARTLGLKELADRWLGMPPEERDAVTDWVLANKARLPRFPWILNSKKEPNAAPSKKNAGAWIGFCPADLVAPYAIGDVERTWRLFQTLLPVVQEAGMGEAYDVERALLPHLMENERVGIRVDHERLASDVAAYSGWFDQVEDWLRWRLDAPGLSFDKDADVASVLASRGVVTQFVLTASGRPSVSKDNLTPDLFADPAVASALGYRNRLKTVLDMHMRPMLAQADARGGWAMGEWNQVASPDGGTRTGRPSMRGLNFLNVSKDFEGQNDGYAHPEFLTGLPKLPLVRNYVLADEGHVINDRDFSGQELRLFAHFEQGDLMRQYQRDPKIDVHQYIGNVIADLSGDEFWRTKEARAKRTKTLNFQALYGGGIPAAVKKIRCTEAEARQFKAFHDRALPGRKILSDTLTSLLRQGYAVRTYGGRLYVREPLKLRDGRWQDHDYAMINYLIQGSAADFTKRALLRMLAHPDYKSRFLLNVYDELVISSPIEIADQQSLVMKEAMQSLPLRVAMLTEAAQGIRWGDMTKRDDL